MSQTIEQAKKANKPSISKDINGKFACTLCGYTTRCRGFNSVQRHIITSHGIKLIGLEADRTNARPAHLGSIFNDYGLMDRVRPEDIPFNKADTCSTCNHTFLGNAKGAMDHMKACEKSFKKRLEFKKSPPKCPKCDLTLFTKKARSGHKKVCGQEAVIHCVICPFKSISFSKTRRHMLDKHNLIANRPKEVDFEHALKKAPYTLCRPFELHDLPTRSDVKNNLIPTEISKQIRLSKKGKSNKMFACEKCKTQFLKKESLNKHRNICIDSIVSVINHLSI